jgi:hypothetical protein
VTASVSVDALYEGPRGSANGGLAGGVLAALVPGGGEAGAGAAASGIEVTLRAPVPLGAPLRVEQAGAGEASAAGAAGGLVVLDGAALVAEVRALPLAGLDDDAVPRLSRAAAEAAHLPPGHPHDSCFVCGTAVPGGLDLQPRQGPRLPSGLHLWTAPFDARPDLCDAGRLRTAIAWGLLDCIGSWAPLDGLPPMGLRTGRLHAALRAPIATDERGVVVAWLEGGERRKRLVASAVLGEDGGVRAVARCTWILPRE